MFEKKEINEILLLLMFIFALYGLWSLIYDISGTYPAAVEMFGSG